MRGSKMVGCAIVVALAATACGGGGSDEGDKSKAGGGFSMNIAEPKRLVPQSTTESGGSQVLSGLFTPLVDFDSKNEPVLAAAESIESPDNKVWTVKLKDATWHDGKPVTAQDYVGAWNWGVQMTLALAAGVALPALEWLGYRPGMQQGLAALSLAYALLPCALKLLAAALLWRAPLHHDREG